MTQLHNKSVSLGSGISGPGRLRALLRVIIKAAAWVLSLPVAALRVRFLRLTAPDRIGHLAHELDTYVKAGILGLRPRCHGILIVPAGTAANDCFLDYWRQHIRIVRSRFWCRIGWQLQTVPYLRLDVSNASFNQTAAYIKVHKAWGERGPVLKLTEAHRRRGRAALAEMGVPDNGRIICFHAREPGYSPTDDAMHAYRNCSIENYLPAARELARRGYWCMRMGDASSRPISAGGTIIDYAHSRLRCDWMDVFLCADCSFFLGSSGGLLFMAGAFGTPTATANHAPASTALAFGWHDIAIPKLVRSRSEGRFLTLPEVFRSEIANLRFTKDFEDLGIESVENEAEDILDLALEMVERTEGNAIYTHEDEDLQARFRSLLKPGHYGHGGLNRIGRNFLRKYRSLLQDNK